MTATFFLGLLGRFALVLSTARFREVLLGNAPRTALGETGTFVDAVFSFSAFFPLSVLLYKAASLVWVLYFHALVLQQYEAASFFVPPSGT